jgi:hypothetical protein
LKCFVGCEDVDILATVGLEVRDLFDDRREVRYPYEDGWTVHRSWDAKAGKKKIWQEGPETNGQQLTQLYKQRETKAAVADGWTIMLVEGEDNADLINSLPEEERGRVLATSARMGADSFHLCDVEPLRGAQVIGVVDRDEGGDGWARQVRAKVRPVAASLEFKRSKVDQEKADAADHIMAGYPLDQLETYEPEEPERTSWWPIDLGPIIRGDRQRPQPTVGQRTDGRGLFYRGKSHTVVSETEVGKTWLVLAAAWVEMLRGEHVLYIDWEDDEITAVDRLQTIMPRDDLTTRGYGDELIESNFHYLRPENDLRSKSSARDLGELLHTFPPALAISDGTTEAMALHSLDPIDNVDIATLNSILVKPLLTFGPAVVALDHVIKSREGRGRYALGAVHKLNAVSGAGFLLENIKPFGVGLKGRSRILITKDRPGQLRTHGKPSIGGLHTYGDLVLNSQDDGLSELTVYPPWEDEDVEGDGTPDVPGDKPVELMTKVAALLTDKGALPKRQIVAGISGAANTKIAEALDILILDGYVTPEWPHSLIKPYPETLK